MNDGNSQLGEFLKPFAEATYLMGKDAEGDLVLTALQWQSQKNVSIKVTPEIIELADVFKQKLKTVSVWASQYYLVLLLTVHVLQKPLDERDRKSIEQDDRLKPAESAKLVALFETMI